MLIGGRSIIEQLKLRVFSKEYDSYAHIFMLNVVGQFSLMPHEIENHPSTDPRKVEGNGIPRLRVKE